MADHHYEGADLLPDEHAFLLKVAHTQPPSDVRARVIERLEGCRRIEGQPLPKASLPWAELEAEARRMGVDPMDVFWDRAGKTKGD